MSRPKQKIVILGTRSFAEEVADLIGDCEGYEVGAFAENWDRARAGGSMLGRPIIWVEDLAPLKDTHLAICAIGSTQRSRFVDQAKEMGFQFASIRHPSARISSTAVLGAGVIVSAGVIIAADARIGSHVIVNRGTLIGHHACIQDFVTIGPGSNIAGKVQIGERAYIGMAAVVINDLKIGSGSLIGAGSVVTKDVDDRVQVVGVPARIVRSGISPY